MSLVKDILLQAWQQCALENLLRIAAGKPLDVLRMFTVDRVASPNASLALLALLIQGSNDG